MFGMLKRIILILLLAAAFGFGWLHFFLLFSWDVLHVYGIAAFILLFSRKLSARTMLVVGGALLLFAKPLISGVFEWSGVSVTLDAITSAGRRTATLQASVCP